MLRTERTGFHGDHHPVQMAALSSREYFPLCPLLASVSAQLSIRGGDDARTVCAWGAHHDLALDAIRHSRTGAMLSILSPFETGFRSNVKRQEITLQGVNHQMDETRTSVRMCRT